MIGKRLTRRSAPDSLADTSLWPEIDVSGLGEVELAHYRSMRNAIEAYLSGGSLRSIKASFGLGSEQVIRALNRCITVMDDGKLSGWIGAVRHARIAETQRRTRVRRQPPLSRGGYAGALRRTLAEHPPIKDALDRYIATGKGFGPGCRSKVSKKRAHQFFIQLLQEAGVTLNHWPFCTVTLGRRSVDRYYDRLTTEKYDKVVALRYGDAAATKSKTGTGYRSRVSAIGALDVVELDEYTTDTFVTVDLDTPKGTKLIPIPRMTLIALVDRYSNFILAYDLVLRKEVSQTDVLACLDKFIYGQTLPVALLEDANLPIGSRGSGPGWGFTTLALDNLTAHLARGVTARVRESLGASVSFGPLRQPPRRFTVESIFNQLRAELFQAFPSTTGSHPRDPDRQDPVRNAVKYKVSYNLLIEELRKAVNQHNCTGTSANYGDSPLQQLLDQFRAGARASIPPLLPPLAPGQADLRMIIADGVVRGSKKRGRRPVVNFAGATYTSPTFSSLWDLVGNRILLHADPDDVSTVQAFTTDGRALGTLTATAGMNFPHSLQMRKLLSSRIYAGRAGGPEQRAMAILHESQADALRLNEKSPRKSHQAAFVAEERLKGYRVPKDLPVNHASPERDSKAAAASLRSQVKINFKAIN